MANNTHKERRSRFKYVMYVCTCLWVQFTQIVQHDIIVLKKTEKLLYKMGKNWELFKLMYN